MSDRVGISIID